MLVTHVGDSLLLPWWSGQHPKKMSPISKYRHQRQKIITIITSPTSTFQQHLRGLEMFFDGSSLEVYDRNWFLPTRRMGPSFWYVWDFDIITLEFKSNQVYVFRLILRPSLKTFSLVFEQNISLLLPQITLVKTDICRYPGLFVRLKWLWYDEKSFIIKTVMKT